MKRCSQCKRDLPIEGFRKTGFLKSGAPKYRGDCKDCSNASARAKRKLTSYGTASQAFPGIEDVWDVDLNHGLRPEQFRAGMKKQITLYCPQGHLYQRKFSQLQRSWNTSVRGCKHCLEYGYGELLVDKLPGIESLYDPKLNDGKELAKLRAGGKSPVLLCPYGHGKFSLPINRLALNWSGSKGCSECGKWGIGQSLVEAFIGIEDYWESHLNDGVTPDQVRKGRKFKFPFILKCLRGHEFQSSYSALERNWQSKTKGCAKCDGKLLPDLKDSVAASQKLMDLWDFEKNKVSPDQIHRGSSTKKFYWKCKQYKHSFSKSPYEFKQSFNKGRDGCPYCYGKKASPENCLDNYPHIAKGLHPTHEMNRDEFGNQLNPQSITPHSNKRLMWRCEQGHEWATTPNHRVVNNSFCPECWPVPRSKAEFFVAYELQHVFPEVNPDHRKIPGWRNPGRNEFDALIPKLNVAVEYDSSYYHGSLHYKNDAKIVDRRLKELDRAHRKRNKASQLGWKVIRLRELPLPLTDSLDVGIPPVNYDSEDEYPRSMKVAMDLLFQRLNELLNYEPDQSWVIEQRGKIENYLGRSGLVKYQEALDAYADFRSSVRKKQYQQSLPLF